MKLNLKTSEAFNLNNAIFYAMNNLKDAPFKLGLRLAYNAEQLKGVIAAYEDSRKKVLEKFTVKDEDGQMVVGEDGNAVLADRAGFEAAFQELADETFDIELRELPSDIFPEKIDAGIVGGLFQIIVETTEGNV